jgi:uncharacterized protein
MRKIVITVLALSLMATAAFASNPVRISQVYYGGGAGSGYYNSDYVELFNSGCTAVDISNWQLQYGSATGNFASNTFTILTIPAGATIQPCGYYLVATGTVAGINPLPVTPDYTNSVVLSMSGSAGKVALLPPGTATNQTCAVIAPLAVDMFGWGTATCYEGTAKAAVNYTNVAVRNNGGLTDTDNNNADFTNTTTPVVMHTAASGYKNPDCEVACAVPTLPTTWGKIKTIYR